MAKKTHASTDDNLPRPVHVEVKPNGDVFVTFDGMTTKMDRSASVEEILRDLRALAGRDSNNP